MHTPPSGDAQTAVWNVSEFDMKRTDNLTFMRFTTVLANFGSDPNGRRNKAKSEDYLIGNYHDGTNCMSRRPRLPYTASGTRLRHTNDLREALWQIVVELSEAGSSQSSIRSRSNSRPREGTYEDRQ